MMQVCCSLRGSKALAHIKTPCWALQCCSMPLQVLLKVWLHTLQELAEVSPSLRA